MDSETFSESLLKIHNYTLAQAPISKRRPQSNYIVSSNLSNSKKNDLGVGDTNNEINYLDRSRLTQLTPLSNIQIEMKNASPPKIEQQFSPKSSSAQIDTVNRKDVILKNMKRKN